MKEICPYNSCTGCYACVNTCPSRCIQMIVDEIGELHPIVDQQKCVDCGLCAEVCPNNTTPVYHYPQHCYAAYLAPIHERLKSASGGIGKALTRWTISQNGIVFSTEWDPERGAIQTDCAVEGDLSKYQGSRYVHSIVGDELFIRIQEYLEAGKTVMYISTPCQVAGLLNFLPKEYANLITVDLICHGVSSPLFLKQELEHISKRIDTDNVSDVRFRDNAGHDFHMTLWDEGNIVYDQPALCNYYFAAFLHNLSLRESCYSCKYARPERVADISIGDFIGLGQLREGEDNPSNVSCVLINTPKGEKVYAQISKKTSLVSIPRDYKERLAYPYSLLRPVERHPKRDLFMRELKKSGWMSASRKTLRARVWRSRMWQFLRQHKCTKSLLVLIGVDKK